ncbi:hypothetical protein L3X38_039828 [Prunus dulcis]|uniref:Uncharacterized protein n=1 Tax=Prunus dulcis TaxID=3755 RepID=A0AAD4V7V2_PRUDU|nr:hypothetical protein L3X38_039828 [Prunus dulcis]
MAGWLGNSCPPYVRGNASKGCSNFNFSAARRSARRALPFFRPKVPLPKVDISFLLFAKGGLGEQYHWENRSFAIEFYHVHLSEKGCQNSKALLSQHQGYWSWCWSARQLRHPHRSQDQ